MKLNSVMFEIKVNHWDKQSRQCFLEATRTIRDQVWKGPAAQIALVGHYIKLAIVEQIANEKA